MQCKKCETSLADNAKFRLACGKKVTKPREKKVIDLNSRLGFSAAEAAAAIGVSTWFIYEEIKQGLLGCSILHGRKIIPRWTLEEYLRRHETPARVEVAK